MNSNIFDYYSFQFNFATDSIKKEIDFVSKSNYSKFPPISNYLLYLQNRIGIGIKPYRLNYAGYSNANVEYKKMDIASYTKNLDLLTYQLPWNKLKLIHKQMKITEYINNLTYPKKIDNNLIEKNKKKLIKKILEGFKNKKFNKNKNEVTYDSNNMQITKLDFLSYNKKKGIYVIEWE